MKLKNYMEDLVWAKLDEVLSSHPGVCNCENCRYDIAALALNRLPTCYVATRKGQVYTKINLLEQQCLIDIVSAISHGIEIVRNNPHHNCRDDE